MSYEGPSIVDYLNSTGQKSDFATRAVLAASKGITGYTGSAQQNTQLLNILRGGQVAPGPQTTPAPQTVPNTQTAAQPSTSTPPTSGGTTPEGVPLSQLPPDLLYNGQLDVSNPDKQTKYSQIVQQYKGGSGNTVGATGIGAASTFTPPTINLPALYDSLYATSDIPSLENDLAGKSRGYNEAVAKIKDNPYLSEATMSGRLKKLEDKFNADSKVLTGQIATRKADIETKLNLQTKQFDINSQQAQTALQQFQSLLSAGALNNASGEDIANITRSTGLSSAMIYSAIKALKEKNVETSTIQFDDGTNQGYAIINSKTGEILSKQVIANSKPKAATASETKDTEAAQTQSNAIADVKSGVILRELIAHYSSDYGNVGGLTTEQLYNLYNAYTPYLNKEGKRGASETLEEVKAGKFGV